MKKIKSLSMFSLALLITGLSTVSCKKSADDPAVPTQAATIETMKVPSGFKFTNVREVSVSVRTLDNQDQPVPGVRIDIYTDYRENGGKLILSGMTDAAGQYSIDYKFPKVYDSVVVATRVLGFPNQQKVSVVNGTLDMILGGKQAPALKAGEKGFFKSTNAVFFPMGTYNSQGVPTYLTPTNDIIDASMLNDINASMPESVNLPNNSPEYFTSTNEKNLVLTEACDVWVTFVHEGAGYKNVLGFYKFNTNNPPATTADIDTIRIIFPNTSFVNSGGGLVSGNRVHLGAFGPGTEIGWVIIADGFRNGTITNGNWTLYSDDYLNPVSQPSKKQHAVFLNDVGRGKFLLGFEDIRRDGSSDNDFNDAIFYVTANPISAVNTENIPLPEYTQPDTDGDGVPDTLDDYPTDPQRAFNNFFPSETTVGTLAYEDLWPAKGDYDFNDMVIDYNFNQVTNGQNKVVEVKARLILKAIGASFKNGFGIRLPVEPNQITSVTGTHLTENIITLNGNGTEAGQTKATIIVFDNGFEVLPHPGMSSLGVNTTPGAPYVTPDTLDLTIGLSTPVELAVMGTPPYNPFIFVNQVRGHEVHLVNQPPTDLMDMALFGTQLDDSNPATGRYYVTENNLPWGIDVAGPFEYPVEKAQINQPYNKFIPWGESAGSSYYDWYLDKPGYRNAAYIY